MNNFNFKFYGNIDVKGMQQKIADTAFNWDEFSFRQVTHKAHRETKTVPLLFNEDNIFMAKYWPHYELFRLEIENIKHMIEEKNQSKGTLHWANLIMLPSSAKIYAHTDDGPIFMVSKRIHLSINTNPGCLFTVGGETINIREGELWEINNNGKAHSVINNGNTDRIHLLMDWEPEFKPRLQKQL